MNRLMIAGVIAVFALAGCASSSKSTSGATASSASAKQVNKYCVIMDEHPSRGDASTTVMYKGQPVGFCCEDCIDAWQRMPDAEKDAALKKAIAAK